MGRPMEFILGKQFKLEVWESCVKTMHLMEVAEYTVEKSVELQLLLYHKIISVTT